MRWITDRINRIPERWRMRAQQYGVWIVLVAGIALAWRFDSRHLFIRLDSYLQEGGGLTEKQEKNWMNVLGFWVATLVISPLRSMPTLGIAWALAMLHYRSVFLRFAINTGWRKKAAYVLIVVVLRWVFMRGVTAWLGFDRISGAVVNAWLVFAVLFAYFAHFRRLRSARRQLTEQTTRAELDALKAQINPHFLFNSLNNIFGTALTENGPRTADSVQQLSRILRYMLEQASVDRTSVGTELQFLDEYVLLQKQRLPDSDAASVQFAYEWDEEPAQVAPLLLSPLLDYAFRRSTDAHTSGSGFLRANASVQARQLQFRMDYTCADYPAEPSDELQNVRQRLTLMYPGRHQFALNEEGTVAHLEITINLN